MEGYAAQFLREADAGICIEPENADQLAEAVQSLAALSNQIRAQKKLLNLRIISIPRFMFNVSVRSSACVIPGSLAYSLRRKLRY